MSDLPPGWEWTTIGEAAEVVLGQSPPGTSYNDVGDGLPFFQGKAEFGELHPKVAKWTTAARKVARENDVLLSVRAPVGPTNLAPTTCSIGRGLAALRETSAVGHRYLLWWMRASADDLASRATGSTFAAVSGAQVRAHPMPLAPRAEQERIVAAIEEHLSRLDAAVGVVSNVTDRAQRLRFEIIESRMAALDRTAPLDSIALRGGITDGPFGSKLKSSHYTSEGPRVVRLENIGVGEFIDERTHIDGGYFKELTKHEVRPGDVVVASLVSDRLRACVIPSDLGPAIVKADCIRVRLRPEMDPRFVNYALMRPSLGPFVAEHIRGVGRSRLGLLNVRKIPVPVADLETQRQICDELDAQLGLCSRLSANCSDVASRSRFLRRSILAAAFSGQLVPQDPDDEPASVLLERIRAERAAAAPTKRTRKVKAL